jgi:hypothetical protein
MAKLRQGAGVVMLAAVVFNATGMTSSERGKWRCGPSGDNA